MAEGGDAGDRTEAPTARRLQKAREEGQVTVSREVLMLAMMVAGGTATVCALSSGGIALAETFRGVLLLSGREDLMPGDLGAIAVAVFNRALVLIGPVLLAGALGAAASGLLQTGFLFRPAALVPSLDRISPVRGFGRLFDPTSAVEALKSVAKLACFGCVLFHVVEGALPALASTAARPLRDVLTVSASVILHAAAALLAVQLVIAALDMLWLRHRLRRHLRMSRQDLRDEHKENDGNPHVKARIRAIRRQRARQQMMQAVPKAAVVLTNPTHYAVALAYEQGSRSAPRVVAKGADEAAARIRALAAAHGIPIVENKPLARALFKVPLEQEIPREHFQAVAAVIAYVWRLAQRTGDRKTADPKPAQRADGDLRTDHQSSAIPKRL